jgi:hypothetical protein
MNRVVLLTPLTGNHLDRLRSIFSRDAEIVTATDWATLETAEIDHHTTLISFGAGVIVPPAILARLKKPAYNAHAGPPSYPGRDPHHHAAYDGVDTYGATLHVMTERVDAGPIVAVDTFPVPPGSSPSDLLAWANEACFRLLERHGPRLLASQSLNPINMAWAPRKTTRRDFHRSCMLSPLVDEAEFERRFTAFDGGNYDNLTTRLHGWTFRIDKSGGRHAADRTTWEEFTERGFRNLLRKLQQKDYRFVRLDDRPDVPHVIWRHDVDFSMQRAARIAEIEREEGAIATYFINPRSDFYSILERETLKLVHAITNGGHDIGLHFDARAYGTEVWDTEKLEEALRRERGLLEVILDTPVRTVSWHNPDISNLLDFGDIEIGGLVNAYSEELRKNYVYCSDSNGYWRFKPMGEVIAAGHPRLYLLTHPGWWTPEPMSPSERIDRCLLGRARAVRRSYDALLASGNRTNMRD